MVEKDGCVPIHHKNILRNKLVKFYHHLLFLFKSKMKIYIITYKLYKQNKKVIHNLYTICHMV